MIYLLNKLLYEMLISVKNLAQFYTVLLQWRFSKFENEGFGEIKVHKKKRASQHRSLPPGEEMISKKLEKQKTGKAMARFESPRLAAGLLKFCF